MTRRCFVAVPLPEGVRAALFEASARLASGLPEVRWQRKVENLHVTLQFLGKVSEARIGALIDAMPARLAGVAAFEVGVRGMGAFPSAHHANVLWAGIADPTGSLATIAGRIQSEADPRESGRAYRAHITLGRSKPGVDARAALARTAGLEFGQMTVGEVHVYESRLSRAGSTYVLLARTPLAALSDSKSQ